MTGPSRARGAFEVTLTPQPPDGPDADPATTKPSAPGHMTIDKRYRW